LEERDRKQSEDLRLLDERLQRETEAFEHTLGRQHLNYTTERQKLVQQVEELMRERLQCLEKIEMTENILEKQQELFESKMQLQRQKIKLYKEETIQAKMKLESEMARNDTRQQEVTLN
jgi:acyl-CoA reductase-like NAD-dependent aldehyde dehydrogenase